MSFVFSFFKNSELSFIKKKLVLLYLLNVSDVIFTIFLVNTGRFIEVNFLMAPIISSKQLLGLAIKIVIPFILFTWLFFRMRKASESQLSYANLIINGAVIFYGLINTLHAAWFVLYYLYCL